MGLAVDSGGMREYQMCKEFQLVEFILSIQTHKALIL